MGRDAPKEIGRPVSLAKPKTALIVAPYFLPSNLVGVHRNRLLAANLEQFGWHPIVITVDPALYGEPLDDRLLELQPRSLDVRRVGALPTRLSRAMGLGDASLRGYVGLKREVGRLLRAGIGDVVYVSILPGYASLIGAWAKSKWGIPFVLDYQDPWVSQWGAAQPPLSKAGLAHRLASLLEARVVPQADAVTAVSDGTLDGLRSRGLLRRATPVKILPIGVDPMDHEVASRVGHSVISRDTQRAEIVFLGSIGDGMLESVSALFAALARVRALGKSVRVSLIGVSGQPRGKDTLGLASLAARMGVTESVNILPNRIGYLDALRTMQDADMLLLLGTQYAHYTASKIFPYWLAEKPILGLFHEASSVFQILADLGGGRLIPYGQTGPRESAAELARVIIETSNRGIRAMPARNPAGLTNYSGAAIAATYVSLFDELAR
jgi:hypothetical protein